jgi:allantoinase
LTDFALWGGLVPQNLDQLESLADRGVIGFKAFMSHSGIDDFPRVDNRTLREGMKRAAALNRIVGVHAESETITNELARALQAAGKISIRDYLDSRPIEAELEAIHIALEMAGETGCALHVVHVSCGAGVTLIASARRHGVDVTCETCPHYLTMTEEDAIRIGALAKCAPPLRPKPAQDGLWEYLKAGEITTVGSDHSPSPAEMKTDQNFFRVWGGIAGVQHTFPLLITEGHVNRNLALPLLSGLTTFNVARRFRLPANKGGLQIGADADLVLVDLNRRIEVSEVSLHQKHKHNPYLGRVLTGCVVQTILRGQTIYKDGQVVSEPMGRLATPQHHE